MIVQRSPSSIRVPLRPDSLVNLFPVNFDLARRIDTNTHLTTLHAQDGHTHIGPDHDPFADSARYD
jgi:hypothetical protein